MSRSRRSLPVLCVLAAVLALSLASCAWMWHRPPPAGESVVLKPADLAATWTDAEGGTVTLNPDQSFVADRICGDWQGVKAWEWTDPRSGEGRWRGEYGEHGTALWLEFDTKSSTGDDVVGHLTALRDGDVLKFWTRVGDEDNQDPHCVLTRSGAPQPSARPSSARPSSLAR